MRIDILEKLFIKILNKTSNRKFQIDAEMMNLLGCSKEDFYKLMIKMNYKKDNNEENTYIFKGEIKKRKKYFKVNKNENPFNKLLSLNLNKNGKIEQKDLIGITALLIHAAKIDENYSEKEKNN